MYLMIIILKKEKLLKKLAAMMIEFGFFEAAVLDGEGIENLAMETNPMFTSLRSLFSREYVYNKTILIPVKEKGDIEEFIKLCAEEGIDFRGSDIGSLLAFPCDIMIP